MDLSQGGFVVRHLGPDPDDVAQMLGELGFDDVAALMAAVVPDAIRDDRLRLPEPSSESETLTELRALAERNTIATAMIGMGYYGTETPSVIRRGVLENPAWYTAYTPYQPEISQGRLEALLNFQTVISELTALPVANASLLDEATAAAEAMTLLRRSSKSPSDVFVVDADIHPQTLAVMRTRAEPLGIELDVRDIRASGLPDAAFGLLLSYPTSTGGVYDPTDIVTVAKQQDIGVAMVTDLLALTLLRPPGDLGADIAIGSAQRFGVPMGMGGPHAAFMSVRQGLERMLPGRLVGVSVDNDGRPALRLALQTREQHIRRDRATSNICTSQVLLAVIAGAYAAYHGPEGLRRIAERAHDHAYALARGLSAGGLELVHHQFFDTVAFRVPGQADAVLSEMERLGVLGRRVDDDTVGISTDELTSMQEVMAVWQGVAGVLPAFGRQLAEHVPGDAAATDSIPTQLRRRDDYLTHPVFHRYRSETEMMRYLRSLADKDIALDRAMIPLGSCTMKLNAATAMEPITWPEFSGLHPFAPLAHMSGSRELIAQLEAWLVEVTGYDAVSVQPNAGSQGEFAGLLAIRAYHRSRGDEQRTVCLIPSSAHGTNAASAVMAGLSVTVVRCRDNGDVDIDHLAELLAEKGDQVAALMITYPSTHGVFEADVTRMCEMVHEAGGQVYLDGANLNALVGVARPGRFGADVSHLNLHKTFTIPHGGGGPGVGPVAVRGHLAPFLPGHPLIPEAGPLGRGHVDGGVGPVSAAPWGSAGVLPIPWAYIRMMGADGLRRATEVAILSANYVARRLSKDYPILFTGREGLVAHECILDLRPITKATGVTAEDVAKRLIDYGFHAPTMSFPVAGTLMIEPTESESLAELDRFCEAMIAIRGEIDRIAQGEWELEESPLRHAPHPAEALVAEPWNAPYSRRTAVYPVADLVEGKYWPPVARVDQAFGDRNLMCSCPPVDQFADER